MHVLDSIVRTRKVRFDVSTTLLSSPALPLRTRLFIVIQAQCYVRYLTQNTKATVRLRHSGRFARAGDLLYFKTRTAFLKSAGGLFPRSNCRE
ncbi:hypothetical protein KCP73_22000 [Salmonella enterica subsp. enterica]|nr:hypothetical protein KCP73_22000 [Salmonella enterica subsp. enterica]